MEASRIIKNNKILVLAYIAMVLGYFIFYGVFGIDNNDMGYMLGLSQQFHEGGELYKNIIYVRPPLSVALHSFVFFGPLDNAPVFFSRLFVYAQIAVYSGLMGILVGHLFGFHRISIFVLSVLSFMFNAHNFPAMAWHTIDGIMFSVFSVFLVSLFKRNVVVCTFSMVFALMAALSKQPFYIVPIISFALMIYPLSLKGVKVAVGSSFLAFVMVFVVVSFSFNLENMATAVSSQTSVRDLVSAGFLNYVRDWVGFGVFLSAGITSAVVLLAAHRYAGEKIPISIKKFRVLILLSIGVIFSYMAHFFLNVNSFSYPKSFIDAIFSATLLASIYLFLRNKQVEWLVMIALHGVAWAASISWGYTTVSLFSSASVSIIYILYSPFFTVLKFRMIIGITTVLLSSFVFFISHEYIYSLEGPVKREDSNVDIGDEFGSLKGIYVTRSQAEEYHELKSIINGLGSKVNEMVIGPNWPLFNVVFGGVNPLGVDWLLNAEIGSYRNSVKDRLYKVKYFIVYKKASPSPAPEGRFGSYITSHVIDEWEKINLDSDSFSIYINPKYK